MDDGRAAEDHYSAQRMERIGQDHNGDPEATQSYAEKYLCEILERLGYTKTVRAFNELDRR